MPNIELHGFGSCDVMGYQARVRDAFHQVADALQSAPYAGETVITTVPDDVRNIGGTMRPFIRLIITEKDRRTFLESIKTRLAHLMDLEVVIIHEFVPKKK